MRSKTKVTYLKNGKVKLIMPMDSYVTLLEGNQCLKNVVSMMHECHTIYLEDLGKLETLEWRMADYLNFKRKRGIEGGYYYGNYVLSNHPEAVEES